MPFHPNILPRYGTTPSNSAGGVYQPSVTVSHRFASAVSSVYAAVFPVATMKKRPFAPSGSFAFVRSSVHPSQSARPPGAAAGSSVRLILLATPGATEPMA